MPEPEFEPGHGPGLVSGYPSLHGIIDQKTGQSVSAGATPEEARNLYKREERKKALEDALKYEGEILKHCVGGYCEDVVSGKSRIFSLRDYDGRPRVTIEVKQGESPSKLAHMLPLDKFNPLVMEVRDRYFDGRMPQDPAAQKKMDELIGQEYVKEYGPPPLNIVQVKGAENMKPQPDDIPFVQDFIRSGNYEIVGDMKNTDLFQIGPYDLIAREFLKAGRKPPKYVTKQELDNLQKWVNSGLLRGEPLPDKFATGGAVKMAAGGKVGYNPALVDDIVNRIREKLNG
jgi:hypothetical protein